MDTKELAHAVAESMLSDDGCSTMLGIEIVEADARFVKVRMTVREDMVNSHGLCHGGMIFTLADTAFAFACNSENHSALAAGALVDFLAPGKLGDVLTAEARAVSQAKRKGVYDATVVNQEGRLIAVFRGQSQRLGEPKIEVD